MKLVGSRRITGRHVLLPGPGAAAELSAEPGEDPAAGLAAAAARVQAFADVCGLAVSVVVRPHDHGGSLAFTAPPDLLYTACEVIDQALAEVPDPSAVAHVRVGEENPRLRALAPPSAFWDDEGLTVGTGRHARTWPLDALPDEATLATTPDLRVPTVMITGTNGKTTTTRLLARIATRAGFTVGHTSSDAIVVGSEIVESGDWTGPAAARRVLRDPRVTFAALETARGGLMRRGLVLDGADVAVVTNVGADHFGEWGIDDLPAMAEAKLLVARGLRPGGTLVLNAACPPLVDALPALLADRPDLRVARFGTIGSDAWADEQALILRGASLLPLDEIPITLGGAARHNVENALAAALAAEAAGIARPTIAAGLRAFRPTVADSRGRTNLFTLRGARVVVDFAHNPDSVARLADVVARLAPSRTLLLLGGAGDRPDDLVESLGLAAAALRPDLTVLKELPGHLRGRPAGDLPRRLAGALARGGMPEAAVRFVDDEVDAARSLLAEARPGDLVLLLVHEQLDGVLAALAQAGASEG